MRRFHDRTHATSIAPALRRLRRESPRRVAHRLRLDTVAVLDLLSTDRALISETQRSGRPMTWDDQGVTIPEIAEQLWGRADMVGRHRTLVALEQVEEEFGLTCACLTPAPWGESHRYAIPVETWPYWQAVRAFIAKPG